MSLTTPTSTPRLGARALLLDAHDRVLLLHARDPDDLAHEWWELPGGGLDPGETARDTACREIAEETGLVVSELGELVWTRESRFVYRGRDHHRREDVFFARVSDTRPTMPPKRTPNETLGLLGQHWWSLDELDATTSKLLPPELPGLLRKLLIGALTTPLHLTR